jgi:hypothetical protein
VERRMERRNWTTGGLPALTDAATPTDPALPDPPDPSAAVSSYRHRLTDPSRWEVTRRERWRMRARAGAAVASRGRFL